MNHRAPRYAWKDELDFLRNETRDKHKAHAGCIGAMFFWIVILTIAVLYLVVR